MAAPASIFILAHNLTSLLMLRNDIGRDVQAAADRRAYDLIAAPLRYRLGPVGYRLLAYAQHLGAGLLTQENPLYVVFI